MNTHLNDLLGYKKKKTRHLFRWKVVEAYRAERVQASELEETLGITMKELRRLNRNYFRLRLLPLLQPKNRRKTMKRDADYVKMLERKLADMDRAAGAEGESVPPLAGRGLPNGDPDCRRAV